MDFAKFVSLLEERALFFPRLSSLADPLEGFLSKPTVEEFVSVPESLPDSQRPERERVGRYNLAFMRRTRELIYVSAWHLNEHESAAMWRLYLKSDEGIAVSSTVGQMKTAFSQSRHRVYIGKVIYVDFEQDPTPADNILYLAMHKRRSFEHEREVRAIVFEPPATSNEGRPGILVPVDLSQLLTSVYVAPHCPVWVYDLVQKVIRRYGLKVDVWHSGLDQKPLY